MPALLGCRVTACLLVFASLGAASSGVLFAEDAKPVPAPPVIADASSAAEIALQGFAVAEGLSGSLIAAEPLLANPVSFCFDEQGRIYVCESFRQNAGVTDNRGHDQAWLNDDLAAQTVADRIAYHRQHLGDKVAEYTRYDDRIRLLTDTDRDGRMDASSIFADRFNGLEEGTGAGVLAHRGKVYFTCIPNLWLLQDTNRDGRADVREVLHTGYGVRVAFRGHDLHGLCIGPDRRLYFSIGDRGYNIETPDGRLADPESGAVFRCRLDGSELEVFATGLRNPQELAFDDYGNLFTGDNNSDSGDRARWVYVVPGGDTGWRMAYQYLPDRGPFNREKIWHPYHAEQPAYIVPPVANFADGPSGLAYYPGVGLPESFRGRFFLCDFRGGAANSGIRTFRAQPKGAFFELVDAEQPIWKILATDVAFGPDGSLYVSDWVDGWNGEGKGRIYRFQASGMEQDPLVAATRKLLTEGLQVLSPDEVARLLGHPDQRVRLAAQFELADRREWDRLATAAKSGRALLERLHGIWGIGLAGSAADPQLLLDLLEDTESEVRAQAAHVLGESRLAVAAPLLRAQLRDESPRVRYFTAVALGRLQDAEAVPDLARMLEENADQDPIVRHGGVMGLVGVRESKKLRELAAHPSAAVRIAAVVALRKQRSPLVAEFLTDAEPRVVVEAARAIHDLPLPDQFPELARCLDKPTADDALLRRTLNANFRLGDTASARRLANLAARHDAPQTSRLEALDMLAEWSLPNPRDRVLGMWRPLPERSADPAREALSATFAAMLTGPAEVKLAAARIAARYAIPAAAPVLKETFGDPSAPASDRADALLALGTLDARQATPLISAALADSAAEVRSVARQLLVKQDPEQAIALLEKAAAAPLMEERQAAVAQLGELPQPQAAAAIGRLLNNALRIDFPADTRLDVLLAAARRKEPEIQAQLAEFEASRKSANRLTQFRETLEGGNVARGRTVFFDRTEASCVRCHKVRGRGGEVGPDLTRIARDKTPEYLLEAIVNPNKAIAQGFESVTIADADGRIHVGVVKQEDSEQIQIITADAKTITIPKREIEDRQPAKSPMPEDVADKLSKSDIRDLIAFLSQLK